MTILRDTKSSTLARKHLPDPNKTNDGPVAVITLNGFPYRFHLVSTAGRNQWARVAAYGKQRCARQICQNTFVIEHGASFQGVNKLYCSHTCRGRASEARRQSVRSTAFNVVDATVKAAKAYVNAPQTNLPRRKNLARKTAYPGQGRDCSPSCCGFDD